jgi:diaminopimelate decarboxylase
MSQQHPWLQGLHVHVGSQGCPVELLVAGAVRALELADAIQIATNDVNRIRVLDIGGGLPTVYDGLPDSDLSYFEYATMLRAAAPQVFSGQFRIITEFGRSIFAKCGVTVTKVESVKQWAGQNIAVTHIGANQFLRTAYLPETWPHKFSVFDSNGQLKTNEVNWAWQDLAGPLCFSGDFLGRNVWLPQLQAGDFVVIHDTGAYTVAMYSKYNSRPSTAIYGYEENHASDFQLRLLKDQETTDQVLAFWGQ